MCTPLLASMLPISFATQIYIIMTFIQMDNRRYARTLLYYTWWNYIYANSIPTINSKFRLGMVGGGFTVIKCLNRTIINHHLQPKKKVFITERWPRPLCCIIRFPLADHCNLIVSNSQSRWLVRFYGLILLMALSWFFSLLLY